jgi:hypothetical protein
MRYAFSVLRAIRSHTSKRILPTSRSILAMCGGDERRLRGALQSLFDQGLLRRKGSSVQLTLAGLAVAVATRPRPRRVSRLPLAA